MKIRRFVLCSLIFGHLLSGCIFPSVDGTTVPLESNTTIKDFEIVTLNTPGVMEISQGTEESLEILGDPDVTSSITAIVTDGTLLISSEKDLPSNSSITYKLFVKELSGVFLNGFSVIRIPTYYTSNALELTVNGSGRMDIGDIKAADLKFVINGNGSIEADSVNSTSLTVSSPDIGAVTISGGSTDDLVLELGSGTFLGADLKGTNVKLNMNGSGTAQVWAVEKLDVTINGTGQVIYFGEPTMSMSVSGGGQLQGGGNK